MVKKDSIEIPVADLKHLMTIFSVLRDNESSKGVVIEENEIYSVDKEATKFEAL